MSMRSKENFKEVETYTYHDDSEGEPIEVFLIGVNADIIGKENTFEPNGFNRHHITTWLRKNYLFLRGTVYAQVPRRTSDFAKEAKQQLNIQDEFATDVMYDEKSKQISAFYPMLDSDTVVLTWDLNHDRWTMERSEVPISGGNIDPEFFDEPYIAWSSP